MTSNFITAEQVWADVEGYVLSQLYPVRGVDKDEIDQEARVLKMNACKRLFAIGDRLGLNDEKLSRVCQFGFGYIRYIRSTGSYAGVPPQRVAAALAQLEELEKLMQIVDFETALNELRYSKENEVSFDEEKLKSLARPELAQLISDKKLRAHGLMVYGIIGLTRSQALQKGELDSIATLDVLTALVRLRNLSIPKKETKAFKEQREKLFAEVKAALKEKGIPLKATAAWKSSLFNSNNRSSLKHNRYDRLNANKLQEMLSLIVEKCPD